MSNPSAVPPAGASPSCDNCCLGRFCPVDLKSLLRSRVAKLRKGDVLVRAGDRCIDLYAVHSGAFKSVLVNEEGEEVVCGFRFAGDMLGLESIADGHHACDVVALEDSEVCVLPHARLEAVAVREPLLQRQLSRVLAAELRDRQAMALVLATSDADRRLGAFLGDLSRRFAERGLDGERLQLPMSRPDIAAYLSLSPETVSRAFGRLEAEGFVRVRARVVEILAPLPLRAAAAGKLTPVRIEAPSPG